MTSSEDKPKPFILEFNIDDWFFETKEGGTVTYDKLLEYHNGNKKHAQLDIENCNLLSQEIMYGDVFNGDDVYDDDYTDDDYTDGDYSDVHADVCNEEEDDDDGEDDGYLEVS